MSDTKTYPVTQAQRTSGDWNPMWDTPADLDPDYLEAFARTGRSRNELWPICRSFRGMCWTGYERGGSGQKGDLRRDERVEAAPPPQAPPASLNWTMNRSNLPRTVSRCKPWWSTPFDSLDDFAGGRLAVTPRGNTAEQVARLALSTVGLTYDDL